MVVRLLALPSCEVLEVGRSDDARDLLVPLVRDAVRDVDLDRRVIDVDLRFLGEESMQIDVFTLFPEAFDWFVAPASRGQRAGPRPRAATASTTATTPR